MAVVGELGYGPHREGGLTVVGGDPSATVRVPVC